MTLTTNGYLLAQQAQELKDAGLHRITVSLDSIDDEVFKQMNGRGFGARRVLHAIQRASDVGLAPIKINAVVQRGVNDHTIVDLARHFKGTGHIVRFIEYMDVGNRNGWKLDEVVSADEIIARIDAEMPLEPVPGNYHGEVAERYLYRDGSGEIGVIASVTRPFCGACTRLRLSTDGQIFTCLFATRGTSLRDPMRDGATDDELRDLIAAHLDPPRRPLLRGTRRRHAGYAPAREGGDVSDWRVGFGGRPIRQLDFQRSPRAECSHPRETVASYSRKTF